MEIKKNFSAVILFLICLSFSFNSSAQRCELLFSQKTVTDLYYELMGEEPSDAKATTGVEVEAMIPKSVGLTEMANTAAATVEKMGYEVEKLFYFQPVGQAYKTQTFHIRWYKGEHKYDLKITQDFSVRPSSGYEAVEVVSPILRNSVDAEEHFKMISALKDLGLKEEPNNSGIHVHVGVEDLQPAELGMISWAFHLLEEKIRQNISFSQFRMHYVGFKKPQEIEAIKTYEPLEKGVAGHLDSYYPEKKDRYVGVNIASLRKFGTIEIRLFNSSVNPRVLRFSRHLSRKLIQKIRSRDADLLNVLRRAEYGDVNLDDLFTAIGMDKKLVHEVYTIIRTEAVESEISNMQLKMRTLSLLPQTINSGFWKTVVFPTKAPEGWTHIEDQE